MGCSQYLFLVIPALIQEDAARVGWKKNVQNFDSIVTFEIYVFLSSSSSPNKNSPLNEILICVFTKVKFFLQRLFLYFGLITAATCFTFNGS